jgi:hypothetical protein
MIKNRHVFSWREALPAFFHLLLPLHLPIHTPFFLCLSHGDNNGSAWF